MPLVIAGATSGSTTVQATDAVTATITLPSATGTVQLSGAAASFTDLTTTGNTILGNASTDTLNVGNGGLVKDASGNVGIGTDSPAVKFQIGATGASGFSFDATTSTLASPYGAGGGIVLRAQVTGITGGGQIFLGGSARGDAEIDSITFYTNNTERMRIPPTGGIQSVNCVSVGNATPSTSGAGITFPATQSASTNANTLDDYEEGSCTITLSDSAGNNATMTGDNAWRYIKIGRSVTVSGTLGWSSTSSLAGASRIRLTGLPFQAENIANMRWAGTTGSSASGSFNIVTSAIKFGVDANLTFMWGTNVTGNNVDNSMFKADMGTSGTLFGLTVTYFSAS